MFFDGQQLVGQQIDRYRLLRLLGRGSFGAVFEAEQVSDRSHHVAIKFLMPGAPLPYNAKTEAAKGLIQRFLSEAEILQRLVHPHIVKVGDFGFNQATGLLYMVMPLMARSLAESPVPLRFAECVQYAQELAPAVDYAHGFGIIHRDIKPANILLDSNGHVQLSDFGIAKLFNTDNSTFTSTMPMVGTLSFMAPEQVTGKNVGPLADVYSLGALFYYLTTGHPPFSGETEIEVAIKHVQAVPTPPSTYRPDLKPPAEAAILRALAKKPAERFVSAEEFALAFRLGVNGEWYKNLTPVPTTPALPVPWPGGHMQPAPSSPKSRSSSGAVWAALLVIAVLFSTIFAISHNFAFLSQGNGQPSPTATSPTAPSSSVLYQADWSSGFDGWTADDPANTSWNVTQGSLVNDGSNCCMVLAPYQTATSNYVVEAQIQLIGCSGAGSFGVVGGAAPANTSNGGYAGIVGYWGTSGNFKLVHAIDRTPNGAGWQLLQRASSQIDGALHSYRLEFAKGQVRLLFDGSSVAEAAAFGDGNFVGIEDLGCKVRVASFSVSTL